MFDHVNYDVSDLKRSANFFEQALIPLGYKKLTDIPEYGVVGFGEDRPQFWLVKGSPHAQAGEVHICFLAKTRKQVDEFHAAAISAGGKDNGKPGVRKEYGANYYSAFVLDLDGFNIEAVCRTEKGSLKR
jgi:predicted lactoylglutathione lyase